MKHGWPLVALLSATATASYLCRVNVSVAGVLIMREYGLTEEAMGRIFSAFLLGYALCQFPGGALADRFGAARTLAWAALGWVASTGLIAAAGSAVVMILIGRFLLGVAEAPTFPSAAQAISCWIPSHQRARANGFVIAAIGLGSGIAPPLVTFLMQRWGWRVALLITAIPALLAALAWFAVRAPTAMTQRESTPRRIPTSRSFVLLALSYTLQGYVGYIFVFWFYLYLVNVRHFDLLRGALFGSLPWLLSIVSIPLGGYLFDRARRGKRWIPITGLAGSGLLLAFGAVTASPYLAATALALSTMLVLSVEGPFWATMTELSGPHSGAAGGLMNMGSNIGGLISPAVTPILAHWFGWQSALLLSASLALLAALLWFGITPRES